MFIQPGVEGQRDIDIRGLAITCSENPPPDQKHAASRSGCTENDSRHWDSKTRLMITPRFVMCGLVVDTNWAAEVDGGEPLAIEGCFHQSVAARASTPYRKCATIFSAV
jgi:hypothetical protein